MLCYVVISFVIQLASISAVFILPLFFDKDVEKIVIFVAFAAAENMMAFIIFSIDKLKSPNEKCRITEWVLLIFSSLFGTFGAMMAMLCCKQHRTSKCTFMCLSLIMTFINAMMYVLIGFFVFKWLV